MQYGQRGERSKRRQNRASRSGRKGWTAQRRQEGCHRRRRSPQGLAQVQQHEKRSPEGVKEYRNRSLVSELYFNFRVRRNWRYSQPLEINRDNLKALKCQSTFVPKNRRSDSGNQAAMLPQPAEPGSGVTLNIWRWATLGVRGIELDTHHGRRQSGHVLEAMERFFAALTAQASGKPVTAPPRPRPATADRGRRAASGGRSLTPN